VSHASHRPPLDVVGSIPGYHASSGADLEKKGLRQPWPEIKGRWWLTAYPGEGRLVPARALTMRQTIRNSQNEPGMCPGINRLTFWCGPQTRSPRLAHIAKSAMYVPPEAWFWLRERTQPLGTKPECVLESIVSRSARLSRIGCVGEYLYGAPVLVPAALPWLGPELRRCG